MTTAAILAEAERRGIKLRADGGLIKYKPVSAMNDELLAAMRRRKPELLAHLGRLDNARVGPWTPPGAVAPPRRCISCKGGLHEADVDDGICSTCRWSFEHLSPRRVQ